MKEEPAPLTIIPDALGQFLSFENELKEEKNSEQAICKDLRTIVSKGLSLLEAHIIQTIDDGFIPEEDDRWHELESIRDKLKNAYIKSGYTTGLQGKGWRPEHIEIMREDQYTEINAGLYHQYSKVCRLMVAWGILPMMDKRSAMKVLVSKKLMEGLEDGRKFEIRTDA
jgi:hypothetical protein